MRCSRPSSQCTIFILNIKGNNDIGLLIRMSGFYFYVWMSWSYPPDMINILPLNSCWGAFDSNISQPVRKKVEPALIDGTDNTRLKNPGVWFFVWCFPTTTKSLLSWVSLTLDTKNVEKCFQPRIWLCVENWKRKSGSSSRVKESLMVVPSPTLLQHISFLLCLYKLSPTGTLNKGGHSPKLHSSPSLQN